MVDSAPAVSTHTSRFRGFPPFPKVDVATVKPSRDLALDFVRSWSLLVVVFGHFIMLIVHWSPDNIPTTSNTLSSGNLWPFATWVLQVMPLFFIAGGAVNQASWNRFSGTYSQWVWQRVNRLMRPTVVYLLTLAVIFTIVTFAVPRAITDPWVTGITGPLWFLAVYIPVTALTPWTSRLYKANPVASLAIPLILVVGFDVLRFHLGESLGVPNLIVAWVLVHQLGYVYNSGIKQRFAVAFIVVGLGANIVLTQLTHIYPTSLVGIPTEKFSNMAPPDIILVNHSLVLFGLFVLLAPRLREWAHRPRVFAATVKAGLVSMTIYLWHMLVLVAWLSLLHLVGWDLPTRVQANLVLPDGLPYWIGLIPVACGFVAVLYVIVRFLWPLEHMNLFWFDADVTRASSTTRSAIGVAMLALGLLTISGTGFSGFPVAVQQAYGIALSCSAALVVVLIALALLRQPKTHELSHTTDDQPR